MSVVMVWTKPRCVQCDAVKRTLLEAGVSFVEADLTEADHADHLEYFKGLGFSSAPITEYGGIVTAGFDPAGIQRIIEAWKATT
jgi:glutaredoxin-like protein NrdH